MSFHRVVLVALATLFSIGMTSLASAGCCGWGYSSPVVYAAPVGYGGYGGYGGCCGGPTAAGSGCAPAGMSHPPDPLAAHHLRSTA